MPLRPAGERLKRAFDQLRQIEREADLAMLPAVCRSLDEWLAHDESIPLASGSEYPEAGYLLYRDGTASVWLLPRARVLRVDAATPGDPSPERIDEAQLDLAGLCDGLRQASLEAYLGGVQPHELSGVTAMAVVSDLLNVAWELDWRGREAVLSLLAESMRRAEDWDQAALRLMSGFERGLGDRVPAVRRASAHGLTWMACGLGPSQPGRDPARCLRILFAVPHADVQAATLEALASLPEETIAALADELQPLLEDALVNDDPHVRRLASSLRLRVSGADARALAGAAEAESSEDRLAILKGLVDSQALDLSLLPYVLDALDDSEAEVRSTALTVLLPVLEHETEVVRRRVLRSLLASDDARLVRAAVGHLRRTPIVDREMLQAARSALGGPDETRAEVVELVADLVPGVADAQAVDAYTELLRHEDPNVRRRVIERLTVDPPPRVRVIDELLLAVTEHLRDPIPELRIAAAQAVVGLGYPRATEIVMQLAVDPEPEVRAGLLEVLSAAEAGDHYRRAQVLTANIGTLLDLEAALTDRGRIEWKSALDSVVSDPIPRVPELLAAVLARLRDVPDAEFVEFATEELDAAILGRVGGGRELARICRLLLAPPSAQPEHAARLAAAVAASDPAAFDFLWTLYAHSTGPGSQEAFRALEGLEVPLERQVEAEARALLARSEVEAQRAILLGLIYRGER